MQTIDHVFSKKTISLPQCSMDSGENIHAPMQLPKSLTSLEKILIKNQAERFLDVQKAFNSLDHKIHLTNLCNYGVRGHI